MDFINEKKKLFLATKKTQVDIQVDEKKSDDPVYLYKLFSSIVVDSPKAAKLEIDLINHLSDKIVDKNRDNLENFAEFRGEFHKDVSVVNLYTATAYKLATFKYKYIIENFLKEDRLLILSEFSSRAKYNIIGDFALANLIPVSKNADLQSMFLCDDYTKIVEYDPTASLIVLTNITPTNIFVNSVKLTDFKYIHDKLGPYSDHRGINNEFIEVSNIFEVYSDITSKFIFKKEVFHGANTRKSGWVIETLDGINYRFLCPFAVKENFRVPTYLFERILEGKCEQYAYCKMTSGIILNNAFMKRSIVKSLENIEKTDGKLEIGFVKHNMKEFLLSLYNVKYLSYSELSVDINAFIVNLLSKYIAETSNSPYEVAERITSYISESETISVFIAKELFSFIENFNKSENVDFNRENFEVLVSKIIEEKINANSPLIIATEFKKALLNYASSE
jgi:hypothetical protein